MRDPRDSPEPGQAEPVHTITSAATGRSSDFDARVNRYLISMGIRTVCFVLAIFVTGPMRWVFITGAIVLPYVAVIAANAPSSRRGAGPLRPDDRTKSLDAPGAPADEGVGTLPPMPRQATGGSRGGDPPNG